MTDRRGFALPVPSEGVAQISRYFLFYITVSSFTPSDGQPSSCMFPSLPFTSRHRTHHRPVIYIHHYLSFYRLPILYSFHQRRKPAWTPDADRYPDALYSVQVRVSSGIGQVWAAECVMLSHTACLRSPQFALHPDFPSTPGCGTKQQAVPRLPPPFIDYRRPIIEPRSIFRKILFCPEPSLPVVIGAKFSIPTYKTRLHGVSARFYSHTVKSS